MILATPSTTTLITTHSPTSIPLLTPSIRAINLVTSVALPANPLADSSLQVDTTVTSFDTRVPSGTTIPISRIPTNPLSKPAIIAISVTIPLVLLACLGIYCERRSRHRRLQIEMHPKPFVVSIRSIYRDYISPANHEQPSQALPMPRIDAKSQHKLKLDAMIDPAWIPEPPAEEAPEIRCVSPSIMLEPMTPRTGCSDRPPTYVSRVHSSRTAQLLVDPDRPTAAYLGVGRW